MKKKDFNRFSDYLTKYLTKRGDLIDIFSGSFLARFVIRVLSKIFNKV